MAPVPFLDAAPSWIATTVLLATRLGALFLATPPIGGRAVPATVRLAVVVALAGLLAATLPSALRPAPPDFHGWLTATLREAALGATMAFGVACAFAAFMLGARLLDVQIGFGIGQVLDPLSQQPLPALSGLAGPLALVLFFTADAHHAVLRGVALSLERVPLGAAWTPDAAIGPLLGQGAALFGLGFALVAPVVFCLALVDLGLGALARNLPQMNLFVLGIPLKVLAGIAALALWIGSSGAVVARIHASIFAGWEAMFLP